MRELFWMRIMVKLVTVVSLIGAPASDTHAEPLNSWRAGTHYFELADDVPLYGDDARIEVVEVFWYSCPHCNAFQPYINAWAHSRPADTRLTFVPVQWKSSQRADAKLFYALVSLGRTDLHQEVYDYIHKRGGIVVGRDAEETLKLQLEFAKKHGISAERFKAAVRSAAVAQNLSLAERRVYAYRATATPSIVVNGRYLTDENVAGGHAQLIAVMNHLVELERRRLAAAKAYRRMPR